MKLGAARKPLPPKTKEQKEKEQQQQTTAPIEQQVDDIELLTQDIQKIYGNWFGKEDIQSELKKFNLNKSAAIESLLKQKEQLEKIEERLSAQKIQSISAATIQKEGAQLQNSEMTDFYGYKKDKQNNIDIFVPLNLLKEIEDNFKQPRPIQ